MKKRLAILLITLILAFSALAATRGIGIVQIVRHYPTVYVGNAAGCRMNFDLVWRVEDPGGSVILETTDESEAILTLLVCP